LEEHVTFHLQGQRMSQASSLLYAGFILGLFFDLEGGGDTLL
jgi:hypothetical protein